MYISNTTSFWLGQFGPMEDFCSEFCMKPCHKTCAAFLFWREQTIKTDQASKVDLYCPAVWLNNIHSITLHLINHFIFCVFENTKFPFCSMGSKFFQLVLIMATRISYQPFFSLLQASTKFSIYFCPILGWWGVVWWWQSSWQWGGTCFTHLHEATSIIC